MTFPLAVLSKPLLFPEKEAKSIGSARLSPIHRFIWVEVFFFFQKKKQKALALRGYLLSIDSFGLRCSSFSRKRSKKH
jgi:hypothetical protein